MSSSSPPRLPKTGRGPPNYSPVPSSAGKFQQPPPPSVDDYEEDSYSGGPKNNGQPQPQDKLASVNARVEEVKGSLHKNIELAITRGEKIDDIHDKSEQLALDADTFQKTAKKVRYMFWKRHMKMILICVIALAIIITLIVIVSKNSSSSS